MDLEVLKHDHRNAQKMVSEQSKSIERFMKMGSTSSLLLLSLIDDILNLSKMESGTFKINQTDFCMKTTIYEVYDIF